MFKQKRKINTSTQLDFSKNSSRLIENKPDNKIVIKYNTKYNEDVESEFKISTLSEFSLLLKKIESEYV